METFVEQYPVVVRNKGNRAYTLAPAYDKSDRILQPGKSLAVTEEEAKQLLNYADIEDAAVAVPENAETITRLKAENAQLKAERDARLAAVNGKDAAPSGNGAQSASSAPAGAKAAAPNPGSVAPGSGLKTPEQRALRTPPKPQPKPKPKRRGR